MSQDKRRKCKECGAYKGHHPLCKNITGNEAKKQLVMYYDLWIANEMNRRQGFKQLPLRRDERKGHTCWVFCPICGAKANPHRMKEEI